MASEASHKAAVKAESSAAGLPKEKELVFECLSTKGLEGSGVPDSFSPFGTSELLLLEVFLHERKE